jgi:tRNA U34 5-carboxymethylaminomethyl modifying GTPase MnmE/TrmE
MVRAASIVADLPGTTRDWVGGLAELPTPLGELAVRWFDTPGLRQSADPIEQRAIELARPLLENADVLIAMTDPFTDWPDATTLPREPDLWVVNKADLIGDGGVGGPGPTDSEPIQMVALRRDRLDALARAVFEQLGLASVDPYRPWRFRRMAGADHVDR